MKHLLIVIIGCLSICADGIGQTTTPADTVLAEEYYQKGKALTDALKDFETALDYYEKAAAIFLKYEKWERYVDCLNGLSLTYTRLGQDDKSFVFAKEALNFSKLKLNSPTSQESYAALLVGDYYKKRKDYRKGLFFYNEAFGIYNRLKEFDSDMEIRLLGRLGGVNISLGRYKEAEFQFRKAVVLSMKDDNENCKIFSYLFHELGRLYLDMSYYDSAIHYFMNGIAVTEQCLEKRSAVLSSFFNNIGLTFCYRGDYELGKLYLSKAIDLVELDSKSRGYLEPLFYNNLGIVFRDIGDTSLMVDCYKKSLELHIKYGDGVTSAIDKALVLENLGLFFNEISDFPRAIDFLLQSQKIREKIGDKELLARSFISQGKVYLNMKCFENAAGETFKALDIQKREFGDFHNYLQSTYSLLGDIQFRSHKYLSAAKYFHLSLSSGGELIPDTLLMWTQSYFNTGRMQLREYLYSYMMKGFSIKFLYKETFDISHLLISYNIFRSCDSLISNIYNGHLIHSDKIKVGKIARETYEGAISVSLQLYQLTKDNSYLHSAFYFSERSKAAALSHGLSDLKARSLSGVPQELLSLESRLKSDMAVYQQQAQDEKSKLDEIDSASVSYFQDRLFYATRSYDSLIRVLEKNYPHYYALKYGTNTVSLIDLEAKLDKNTALIEYFVGDSTTYVFYATRGQSGYIALPHTRTLHDDVVALRANLNPQQVYDNPSGSYDAFVKSSARVYDEYVKHVIQKLPTPVTNLIIIPDGSLGYIPFEVLLTARPESGDYASLPYLMKRYRVSYGYSASLLEEYESVRKRNSKVNYLAFAPRYASEETDSTRLLRLGRYRSQVTPLHWNTAEAIRIGRYLPGKSLVDDEAKESVFKEEVNKYSILHLAMHALVDDQRPMNSKFVFSAASDSTEDGFLTANELYAMDLSADLVVLSACETGYGKLEKGEGIMSLARAFSYAGCPSVVMSHWVVDDEATAQLMEYFYKHLSSGLSKDEALQQARVDYLAHADVLKQHPAFWAGFVVLGDTRAITERSSGWVYVMMGGIVLIVVGFYLSKKLRRRA